MISSINGQTIFDSATFLIIVVAALATWSNSRSAKKSSDETDALTTIKIKDLTIETLQKQNTEINAVVTSQGKEIAVLQSDNKRLQAIVENRNPELENFIAAATKSLQNILETNGTILSAIQAILKNNPQ